MKPGGAVYETSPVGIVEKAASQARRGTRAPRSRPQSASRTAVRPITTSPATGTTCEATATPGGSPCPVRSRDTRAKR